ncbi:hypothetical protein L596_014034 [Steinernema carpocapsae]|uniref:Uncharacterized protein n=1 Tax=Steinernema carpocapsae TaxID=34508 RepID=A0A4U5NAJ0_STECR|nr:hypothetical protein L596_014034 [Steinernema carpocapsae]
MVGSQKSLLGADTSSGLVPPKVSGSRKSKTRHTKKPKTRNFFRILGSRTRRFRAVNISNPAWGMLLSTTAVPHSRFCPNTRAVVQPVPDIQKGPNEDDMNSLLREPF